MSPPPEYRRKGGKQKPTTILPWPSNSLKLSSSVHRRSPEQISLDSLALKDIKFDPQKGLENLADLRRMDIYINTSYQEGMPNGVLEAMACGLPVVATDAGDTPDVVEHGVTGYICPTGDLEAMVARHGPALLREVARLHVRAQRATLACEGASGTACTILTELGRAPSMTLAQLARRWLRMRSEAPTVIPGARTPEQVEQSAGAASLAPLSDDDMAACAWVYEERIAPLVHQRW